MSYRMTLIDTLKDGTDVLIGKRSNGDFDITIGDETMFIPWSAAEDIAKYILSRS